MLPLFAKFVVKNRVFILLAGIILAAIGFYGTSKLQINYDIYSYLPQDVSSTRGIRIVNENFKMGTSAQILLENKSDIEILQLKETIENIDGVEKLVWAGDLAELTVPREFWPEELTKNYYSKNHTLVHVYFEKEAQNPATKKAFSELTTLINKNDGFVAGSVAISSDIEKTMQEEMQRFFLATIVLVSLVLLLTIPSVLIPILFMMTIGLSVLINIGTSYFLGQDISYITSSITLPLQFAVTMDYALFLYHRFKEEKVLLPEEQAMENAIVSTFKSISAASFTTIAGFLALTSMRLEFGSDIGITLARGVLITLISVITFLPSLILTFSSLIDRVSHKTYLPDFVKADNFITRHSRTFTIIFVALFAIGLYGNQFIKMNFNLEQGMPSDLPSIKASDTISGEFGKKDTAFIVFNEADNLNQINQVITKIEKVKGVNSVFGYTTLVDTAIPEDLVPHEVKDQFVKNGNSLYTVDLLYSPREPESKTVLYSIDTILKESDMKAYLTGTSAMIRDIEEISKEDSTRVNLVSVLAIFLIIMIIFRSISIPLVLVASIETAILINQTFYIFSGAEIPFVAALAIGSIQLGSTVDYSILMTTRYEEELKRTGNRFAAISKAIQESAQTILVSAGTMFAATVGMAVLGTMEIIKSLGILISRGAVISFFSVVFLLPALLVVFQKIYEKTSFKWPQEVKNNE